VGELIEVIHQVRVDATEKKPLDWVWRLVALFRSVGLIDAARRDRTWLAKSPAAARTRATRLLADQGRLTVAHDRFPKCIESRYWECLICKCPYESEQDNCAQNVGEMASFPKISEEYDGNLGGARNFSCRFLCSHNYLNRIRRGWDYRWKGPQGPVSTQVLTTRFLKLKQHTPDCIQIANLTVGILPASNLGATYFFSVV
jgi:hypothetical protein